MGAILDLAFMSLTCGIVGLPNVGKSTLFNALTKSYSAESANFPFCTIDPNTGVVDIPDLRLDQLAEMVQTKKKVPATIQFVDIAGLVEGASKGEGLGNQFLSHIASTHAILHVVCCFEDANITHVTGSVNPIRDVEIVELELLLADTDIISKRLDKIHKAIKGVSAKSNDREAMTLLAEKNILEKVAEQLSKEISIREQELTLTERQMLRLLPLLTSKPVLYLANVSEDGIRDIEQCTHFNQLKTYALAHGANILPVSAKLESELVGLNDEETKEFLSEFNIQEPGLHRVIRSVNQLLGYITFFTAGPQEVKAWKIHAGSTAYVSAALIHSDIQRGFIRAEVTSMDDFLSCGGLKQAQEAGKMKLEGKDYIVQDADIIYFRFNV